MRLIVTRPDGDASRTIARLEALGHICLTAPLLSMQVLPPPPMLRPHAAMLVTSANAVRAVATWPPTLVPRGLRVLAVGDRTAATARSAGFLATRSAEGDAGDLAALVRSTLDPGEGPLLYPTLAAPARDLAAMLADAGFMVDRIEAYRMIPATRLPEEVRRALRDGRVGGVLLYSRRTAEIFARLVDAEGLGPRLAELAVYTLSAGIAEAVPFGRIKVAAAPNEAALIALIGARTSSVGIE